MGVRRVALLTACTASLALPARAETPLSVIDWLGEAVSEPDAPSAPVAESANQPEISVAPLETSQAAIGLVPADVTGLPVDLWRGSDPRRLERLIETAPVEQHPPLQALLYSLLLTEALPPASSAADKDRVLLARIDRLMDLGVLEPAKALIEVAGPARSPALFQRWSDASFLAGTEDDVCAALDDARHLAPNRQTLIFCIARRGAPQEATLLFDTSLALGDLDQAAAPVLDRFLHPELFEEDAPLPQPRSPDPLTFRLFETIGERLPTTLLQRRFAATDLRDVAGWKAQLEAAERLARTSAISANTLLGLYTERLPAASGGVWDRVAAVQRFETALQTGSAEAIAKTLPVAWDEMGRAGLSVAFAELFAVQLAPLAPQTDPADCIALKLALLSSDYETLAPTFRTDDAEKSGWIALATGADFQAPASDPVMTAVAAGFAAPPALPDELNIARYGESALRLIDLFDRGAAGNLDDLTDALLGLRALGLEDVARRASLHLLIKRAG